MMRHSQKGGDLKGGHDKLAISFPGGISGYICSTYGKKHNRQLWKNMLDRMIPQNQYSKAGAIPALTGQKYRAFPVVLFVLFSGSFLQQHTVIRYAFV